MAEKVSGFSNNGFRVLISSGPTYPPMSIIVHEFRTPDPGFLVFKEIMVDKGTKIPHFVDTYSPPLGITDFSQDVEGKLESHIHSIIENQRNYGEVVYGDTSQLSWDVFEAVRRFQLANPLVSLPFLWFQTSSTIWTTNH